MQQLGVPCPSEFLISLTQLPHWHSPSVSPSLVDGARSPHGLTHTVSHSVPQPWLKCGVSIQLSYNISEFRPCHTVLPCFACAYSCSPLRLNNIFHEELARSVSELRIKSKELWKARSADKQPLELKSHLILDPRRPGRSLVLVMAFTALWSSGWTTWHCNVNQFSVKKTTSFLSTLQSEEERNIQSTSYKQSLIDELSLLRQEYPQEEVRGTSPPRAGQCLHGKLPVLENYNTSLYNPLRKARSQTLAKHLRWH